MPFDVEKFAEQFAKEYDFIYNAEARGATVSGYQEAVDFFDDFAKGRGDVVGAFARYRGDFISSDREAAAFAFALEALGAI